MVLLETQSINSYNRLAYNAINKKQSSKAEQEGKKRVINVMKKKERNIS